MKTHTLLQTDSIAELARFWDTHDVTEFDDQLEELPESIFERRRTELTIRLQSNELAAVRRIANTQGVQQAVLVRQWVLEKLEAVQSVD